MKSTTLLALCLTFVMVSCNQKNKESETGIPDSKEVTAQLYSCPMHPEITGNKGDKCPKCDMDLTETVKSISQSYSCPMHPEVTGNKGDKCPKCEMDLTEPIKSATEGTH